MLALDSRSVVLVGMNPRIEHHGEDTVRAVDLMFSFETMNTVLDELADGLRLAFYTPADQAQLPGTEIANSLRWPFVKSVKWDEGVVKDVMFIVHGSLQDEPDMAFADSKVGKLKFQPKQGGTVKTFFQAQVYADPQQISRLYTLLDEGCKVTWRPMSKAELDAMAARQKDMFPDNPPQDGPGDDDDDDDHDEGERAMGNDVCLVNGQPVTSAKEAADAAQLEQVADTMRTMDAPASNVVPLEKPSHVAKAIKANENKQARAAAKKQAPKKPPAAKKAAASKKPDPKGAQA